MNDTQNQTLTFYFDTLCPWAWRTSLWIREVAKQTPLQVEWNFFSLKVVNAEHTERLESLSKGDLAFRVMALVKRKYPAAEANSLIEQLYLALGQALHDRKEDIGQADLVKGYLTKLELDTALVDEALADATLWDDVLKSHNEALAMGGFGVPGLALPGMTKLAFGPVIDRVPQGEEAVEMWQHVSWLMQRPEFFELKKSR